MISATTCWPSTIACITGANAWAGGYGAACGCVARWVSPRGQFTLGIGENPFIAAGDRLPVAEAAPTHIHHR
jgi:hypothetical protein